jgi:hypothetical protein
MGPHSVNERSQEFKNWRGSRNAHVWGDSLILQHRTQVLMFVDSNNVEPPASILEAVPSVLVGSVNSPRT